MDKQPETIGELGAMIGSIKETMQLHAKVAAFGAVIVAGVLGFLYSKMDAVETGITRLETKLEMLEPFIKSAAADIGETRKIVQAQANTVLEAPMADIFAGWKGVQAESLNEQTIAAIKKSFYGDAAADKPVWVYFPTSEN